MKNVVKLVVLDMAGTTVKDDHEVERCFYEAAIQSDLPATRERIKAMQGYPKLQVMRLLWAEAIGQHYPEVEARAQHSYAIFKEVLEAHYHKHPVYPTKGALELFEWLRGRGIKIALTTGFYRQVTNIILKKLEWDKNLMNNYLGHNGSVIDLSLTPDETGRGRPYPDMILKAMEMLNVSDSQQVINIGDTPADLQAGKAARCLKALAVTNGTHTREELSAYDNDGLLDHVLQVRDVIEQLEASYTLS